MCGRVFFLLSWAQLLEKNYHAHFLWKSAHSCILGVPISLGCLSVPGISTALHALRSATDSYMWHREFLYQIALPVCKEFPFTVCVNVKIRRVALAEGESSFARLAKACGSFSEVFVKLKCLSKSRNYYFKCNMHENN